MDVVGSLPANTQSPEAVQSGDRAFDHPTVNAQPGTVRSCPTGNGRLDALGPDRAPVLVVVVAAVAEQDVGTSSELADQSRNRGHFGRQRQKLGDVLRLPPVSDTASGMPCPSTRMRCLLPGLAQSTGLGPLWATPSGPHVGGAHHRTGPVQLPGRPQPGQQHGVQPAPHAGLVPGCKAPPTRHARAEAPVLGAGTPTGCRCAARTGSRTGLAGPAPVAPRFQFHPGTGSNGSISDHSSSETTHGRASLFPTAGPTSTLR